MPTRRPILRCFPRADRAFQRDVEAVFDVIVTRGKGRLPEPAALEAELRQQYTSAVVRPQDELAAFEPDQRVWYVHRRDEPAAATASEAVPGAVSPGAARSAQGPGSAPTYSAARVAEMIGVPMSVLVGWDERDRLVQPARTSGGLALYSRNDVETLLFVKRAFAAGRSADDVRASLEAPRTGASGRGGGDEAKGSRRLLVLLAERDPYAAEFSEYFLRTEGYEVEVALTALEAEARAAELLPDLAVVELLISGGAGAELCARLKSRPEAKVLAISTLDFEDGALRAGADAFLSKPFDPLAFVSAVKDLLGESAMLRAERPHEPGADAGAGGR